MKARKAEESPPPGDDLDQAAARADAAAAGPAPGGEFAGKEAEPTVEPDPVAECAHVIAVQLLTLGKMASMRYPSLAPIYTVEACRETANDIAPALIKLGWWSSGSGDFVVYLKALGASFGLGMVTWLAAREDIAAERSKAGAGGQQETAARPNSDNVHAQTALYP